MLGAFGADIEVDKSKFNTKVYVVGIPHMNIPILVGDDLISQAVISYDEKGIIFSKPLPPPPV